MIGGGVTFFQMLSLIMIAAVIIINVRWFRKDKHRRYISVLMLVWMTHAFLFYVVLLLEKSGVHPIIDIRFTNWSSILRWHTYVTIFTIEIGRLFYKKTMKLR